MNADLQVGWADQRPLSENSSNVIDDDQWHMVTSLTFVTGFRLFVAPSSK